MHDSPCRGLGRWARVLALLALLGAMGCSTSPGTVSGKVYYQGTPLKGGNVLFRNVEKNQSGTSSIAEDGSYTIPQLPPGLVKITVETESLKVRAGARKLNLPPGAPNKPMDPEEAKRRYVEIPGKYADVEQSGLTFTVKGGKQDHDVKLE